MKATRLKSGTLYPILMRLSDRGLITSKSELSDVSGRPARQVYELTARGRFFAREALNQSGVEAAPVTRFPTAVKS